MVNVNFIDKKVLDKIVLLVVILSVVFTVLGVFAINNLDANADTIYGERTKKPKPSHTIEPTITSPPIISVDPTL